MRELRLKKAFTERPFLLSLKLACGCCGSGTTVKVVDRCKVLRSPTVRTKVMWNEANNGQLSLIVSSTG